MRLLLVSAAIAIAALTANVDATAASKWHSSLLNARRAQAASISPSPSASIAASASGTASGTPAVTPSMSRSAAGTPASTPASTPSVTPSVTRSHNPTPSPTASLSFNASPSSTVSSAATRSTTSSSTPVPSVSSGVTPSPSPLPPAIVRVVQVIRGLTVDGVLGSANIGTVGAALRNAVKEFVATTADTGNLRVLITALINLATGARVEVDANSPLNTGSRRMLGELHGPLDVANAVAAEAPAEGAVSGLVEWALGPRALQVSGFRVEYAVVVPASNVVDTGSGPSGDTARRVQEQVAQRIATAVMSSSNTATFDAIAATAVAQVAAAVGASAGSVTSALQPELTEVEVQANPRASPTASVGPSPSVIAGAVIGAVVGVALVGLLVFATIRCSRRDTQQQQPAAGGGVVVQDWRVGAAPATGVVPGGVAPGGTAVVYRT